MYSDIPLPVFGNFPSFALGGTWRRECGEQGGASSDGLQAQGRDAHDSPSFLLPSLGGQPPSLSSARRSRELKATKRGSVLNPVIFAPVDASGSPHNTYFFSSENLKTNWL